MALFPETYLKQTEDKKFNSYYAPLFGSYEKEINALQIIIAKSIELLIVKL